MTIAQIFHCSFCGHEIKADVCPKKCSCCGRSRFFIDLDSFNKFRSECEERGKSRVRGGLGSRSKMSLETIKLQDATIEVLRNENKRLKQQGYKIFAGLLVANIIILIIIFL